MKKVFPAALIVVVSAVLLQVGYWYGQRSAGKAANPVKEVLYYVDPMNPAHTSTEPGLAPCGMKMEPVYAAAGRVSARNSGVDIASRGAVFVSPDKQQLVGIRVDAVEKGPLAHRIRTLGRVVPDEDRTYRLNIITDGIVRDLFNSSTGSLVQKNERLATYFSREFLAAEQAFFYALNTFDRLKATEDKPDPDFPAQALSLSNSQLQSATENLETLGMAKLQIEELAKTRQYMREIDVYAPATGIILQRNISPGQRIERGAELFRLADLGRVWVMADLFETDGRFFLPGSTALVRLPHQSAPFHAMVSNVPPQFDPVARTLKIRLEVDNPDFTLRPDMFVDVEFTAAVQEAVSVPTDALMDSGARKVVYVSLGDGYFEPRDVRTGWRTSERIEILEGLLPGEMVVVSGNFLLDSESRMKLARAGLSGKTGICPSCGMPVQESRAKAEGRVAEHEGKTYLFCSDACKRQFEEGKPAAMRPVSHDRSHQAEAKPAPVKEHESFQLCPVCLMRVRVTKAEALGRFMEHSGLRLHFCSDICKEEFSAHPQLYPARTREGAVRSGNAHQSRFRGAANGAGEGGA